MYMQQYSGGIQLKCVLLMRMVIMCYFFHCRETASSSMRHLAALGGMQLLCR